MRKINGIILVFILWIAMISGAEASQNFNWQEVNRQVAPTVSSAPAPEAYLKVYTEARDVNDDRYIWHLRLPYTIYSQDGKKIQWVKNDDNNVPTLIKLPPGKYVIVPDVTFTKREIIGAVLEQGKITEIHCQGEQYKGIPLQGTIL